MRRSIVLFPVAVGLVASTVTVLLLLLALAADARAAPRKPGTVAGASQKLVPGLQRLSTPSLRSAPHAVQARRLSLPTNGPGSLLRQGNRVVVTTRVSSTAPAVVQALRNAGAKVITVSSRYRMITAAVAPADLGRIGGVSGVHSVMPALQPMTAAQPRATGPLDLSPDITNAVTCPFGSVHSEGDTQLHADQARSAFPINGSGVKVGIISDSFNTNTGAATHAAGDVATGDLPGAGNPCGFSTPVQNLLDFSGGEDEGRAMAQVVHDLAPGSPLAFESGFPTSTAFLAAVSALRSAGAKVIADDVTYFDEPFFQEGPDAVAVDNAAAAGIPYFSSAANSNVILDGNNVSSWEAPSYRRTTCPSFMNSNEYLDCMNFAPTGATSNGESITVAPGGGFGLDLQWNEPWFGVRTDLDVFLLNSRNRILASGEDDNVSTQEPFEFLSYTNPSGAAQTVKVVIARFNNGAATPGTPRLKYVLSEASGIQSVQFPTSSGGDIVGPTIFGHNGAAGAMSIAAVPFNNGSTVETFSSRGPVTHYFGPVTGTTPAARLASPQTLAKPDVAATDGAATTFFAQLMGGVWRFFGTSEAAPHAAAIAALLQQELPHATVAQIRSALTSSAVQVGAFGSGAEGHGLLNAVGAVNSLLSPTAAFIRSPAAPVAGTAVSFDGSGSTDPNPAAAITAYSWNFGDGASSSSASPRASHTYANPGTYTVTLTVTDSAGRRSAVSHPVAIAARAATAPPPKPPPPATPPPAPAPKPPLPQPPVTTAPPPTPVSQVVCKVPNVKRKSLAKARKTLRKRHCSVGRVKSTHKPKHGPGKHKKWVRVVSRETPHAGTTKPRGFKVALKLRWKSVRK